MTVKRKSGTTRELILLRLRRFVTNRFLAQNAMAHAVEQKVEWAYAFDVHCNSFFPLFLILYVVQFFFMPLLQRTNWISTFVGNTMYLCAITWYIYGTFLGYNGKHQCQKRAWLMFVLMHVYHEQHYLFWSTLNCSCIPL